MSDRGHLRLGECDPRGERAVAQRVDARVFAEDDICGDAALVLAHVRKQHAAVHVADRVKPVVPGDAERVVDGDVLPRLEADRLQPEVTRRRSAADADEDLVALEHRAVLEGQADGAVPLDGGRMCADDNLDVVSDEAGVNQLGRELLFLGEHARTALDERDARAEGRPCLT